MLVYLDTAHFDWIERVLASPVDARQFFERWRASGYELAVSYHHVEECAQLASDASIDRRLAILWEFPRVWYARPGSGEVWSREIEVQLMHLSGDSPAAAYDAVRTSLFHPVKPEAIRRDLFSALARFRKGRLLHESAATLDNHFTGFAEVLRASGIKPRRLKNTCFTSEMAEMLIAHVRKLRLPPSFDIFAGVEDRLARAAADAVSVREAIERYHNLTGVQAVRLAPDADLGELSVFFYIARHVASRMDEAAKPNPARFSALVSRLNAYECPGFRLRLALLRARRSAPKRAVPGDMIDADHLVYAAHVDLAMVGKRTFQFLQQEANRMGGLLPTTAVRHVRRSSSLADLFCVS